MAPLAAAGGVFVRDVGAGVGSHFNGPLPAEERVDRVFNAYELTYTLAVFSTVRVAIVAEAPFGDWQVDFGESAGSFVATFRPPAPGVHRVTITNVEARDGQLGVSIEQRSGFPPEFELSLLGPLTYLAAVFLAASGAIFAAARRRHRGLESEPIQPDA